MTATNHAVTGALVAVLVDQPVLALPIAFLMHFVMDAIPHYGSKMIHSQQNNYNKQFQKIIIADIILAGILLVLLPTLLSPDYSWWVVFSCMFLCMSPDLVWGWRLYFEIQDKKIRAKNWFSRFHAGIQWSETPKGIFVELIWFIAVLSVIQKAT